MPRLASPPRADRPAVPPAGPFEPWRPLALAIGGPVALYLALVSYRWDYLSHYLVGAALVLAAAAGGRALRLPGDAPALVTAAGVLVFGALSEAWWFGDLVYDWSDVGAGGLGAACAAAAVAGRRTGSPGWVALGLTSGGLLAVGLAARLGPLGG